MFMGKIVVQVPLITWRDGRPRFSPGPRLRKPPFNFKGEDLRHGKDGPWFDLAATVAWSEARQALITATDAEASPVKRKRLVAGAAGSTVGQLFETWFKLPRMNGKAMVEGKRRRDPLSANTVRYYKNGANQLEQFDHGNIWNAPAAAITTKTLNGVLNRIEVKHGLSTARNVRAAISSLYAWAIADGKASVNPVAGGNKLPIPEPRIRFGSIEEMRALVFAADDMGRPEVGDAIMLGLWTGQRQGDRLALEDGRVTKDGIHFQQGKKKKQPLLIPAAPDLTQRLAAARHRRSEWRVNYPHVILNEEERAPFKADWYKKLFRRAREYAATGKLTDAQGKVLRRMPPCASLADFHDQDLRDTAVTWMALGGCTKFEIASITGHSLGTIDDILKHYLGMHPDLARTAIGKLVTWYEGEAQ